MKLMASGVTISAAITRSPSFSRSSSSTTTIIRPALSSRNASSMLAKANRFRITVLLCFVDKTSPAGRACITDPALSGFTRPSTCPIFSFLVCM